VDLFDCQGTFNQVYNSKLYPTITDQISLKPITVESSDITYIDNMFRTLRLKYLVGRLNNIGCYCNAAQAYNYTSAIDSKNNMIGGRYFYKIGDFTTEVISVNLLGKTIGDIFATVVGSGSCSVSKNINIPKPTKPEDEFAIYETNATPVIETFTRMMDEINFSSGLLEDSRNLFNALL
jgi:hypothetical protein